MDATRAGSALPERFSVFQNAKRLYTETFLDEWGVRRAYRGRVVALIFLFFLIAAIRNVITSDRPYLQIVSGVIGLVAFGVCFAAVIWKNTPFVHANRAPVVTTVGILIGLALLAELGRSWIGAFALYTTTMLIFNFTQRCWKYVVVGMPLAVMAICCFALGMAAVDAVEIAGQAFLIGLIQAAFFSQIKAKSELRQARADLARLAVSEERLRISRDLHDILGQRLSALSLKAEVASRLTARDPEAAAREMAEVADVARAALADVRDTVSGYRSVSLDSEIETARTLLKAAGVTFAATAQTLPSVVDECAGWIVREAVTNVIRHATASNCAIKVISTPSLATVEVSDDGSMEMARRGREHGPMLDLVYGNGLTGLSERVNAIGGVLMTRRESGWFTVRATFPLPVAS